LCQRNSNIFYDEVQTYPDKTFLKSSMTAVIYKDKSLKIQDNRWKFSSIHKFMLTTLKYIWCNLQQYYVQTSGGQFDIFFGGGQTLMKAMVYTKEYAITNESSPYSCKSLIIGGQPLPSSSLHRSTLNFLPRIFELI